MDGRLGGLPTQRTVPVRSQLILYWMFSAAPLSRSLLPNLMPRSAADSDVSTGGNPRRVHRWALPLRRAGICCIRSTNSVATLPGTLPVTETFVTSWPPVRCRVALERRRAVKPMWVGNLVVSKQCEDVWPAVHS